MSFSIILRIPTSQAAAVNAPGSTVSKRAVSTAVAAAHAPPAAAQSAPPTEDFFDVSTDFVNQRHGK